jgi:hypothetical protein
MPSRDPTPVARRIGPKQRCRSSRDGSSLPIWVTATLRASGFSRLRRISAMPNIPMASTAKSMPSDKLCNSEGEPVLAGLEVRAHLSRAASRTRP